VRLHHMGYVVQDIEPAIQGFERSLQAQWDNRISDDPNQKVRVAFLTTRPGDAQIELVQPVGEDSPVHRFLREKGGGLHHACYMVPDLERQITEMRSRGTPRSRSMHSRENSESVSTWSDARATARK